MKRYLLLILVSCSPDWSNPPLLDETIVGGSPFPIGAKPVKAGVFSGTILDLPGGVQSPGDPVPMGHDDCVNLYTNAQDAYLACNCTCNGTCLAAWYNDMQSYYKCTKNDQLACVAVCNQTYALCIYGDMSMDQNCDLDQLNCSNACTSPDAGSASTCIANIEDAMGNWSTPDCNKLPCNTSVITYYSGCYCILSDGACPTCGVSGSCPPEYQPNNGVNDIHTWMSGNWSM